MLIQTQGAIDIVGHVQEPIVVLLPSCWALRRGDGSLLFLLFP